MKVRNKRFGLILSLILAISAVLSLAACGSGSQYGHFERVGELNIPRAGHTATLLKDGRVLIAGGSSTCYTSYQDGRRIGKGVGCRGPLKSLEIYDPKTKKFTLIGELNERHWMPSAPLLPDGRVVFIGGPGRHAEIFDPVTGKVTLSGEMIRPRKSHTITLLKDGNILVAGGLGQPESTKNKSSLDNYDVRLDSAEIFNLKTGKFILASKMRKSRFASTQTVLLPDGNVFFANGGVCESDKTQTAEIYNSVSGTFELLDILVQCRGGGRAVLLSDNDVLIIGGSGSNRNALAAEIIDLRRKSVSISKSMLKVLDRPAAVMINPNTVLLFGGVKNGYGSTAFLKSAFLYQPSEDMLIELPDMPERRLDSTATILKNGNVLIVGGQAAMEYSKTADVFVVGEGLKHGNF